MAPGSIDYNSPVISPDLDSKRTISGTQYSTLIPRGLHGDRDWQDKPITSPTWKNKPGIPTRREEGPENKFL